MNLLQTHNLETWAKSKSSENRLPYYVNSLICAVIQPEKLRFPSGDAIWLPGFDGMVISNEKNRFVPYGRSMWEVSTQTGFKGKANKEYKKRSYDKQKNGKKYENKIKSGLSDATFVFDTPFVWKDKINWEDKKKEDGIWKNVRVIDGVELVDWLAIADAVNLQLADELNIINKESLDTIDNAWDEWSRLSKPPISEELIVVGRLEQEKDFFARLNEPPSTFTIRGDSPREAYGFALSALRRVNSDQNRHNLYARTIVAENEKVARSLKHIKNLIIILKEAQDQVSGYLSAKGCHAIIPEGNDAYSERNVIALTRTTRGKFTDALKSMGMLEKDAERAARESSMSVTVFQRLYPHENYVKPNWISKLEVGNLSPALLAGRWSDSNKADQQILCILAEDPDYDNITGKLQEFLRVDEPPLQKIGEMWTLTAPVDAFQLIARDLTAKNMKCFKKAFREVFGRIDPKVELPPDKWLLHDIGGDHGHSNWLRSGIAEILLLIAERGPKTQLSDIIPPQIYVDEVVNGILDLKNDWRVLASLRDQYALLMEAAPDPLSEGLESLLEAKSSDLKNLFYEGGYLGTSSMHTGILWALEILAWKPEYLPRITLILAKLTNIDPGGELTNRPINSLREIFLWWHPGTNASFKQRLAALDLILDREPTVGWKLLTKLLPGSMISGSISTAKPRWRDFGDIPDDTYTRSSQYEYISEITDRVIKLVGSDFERWNTIFESLNTFSAKQQEKILDLFSKTIKDIELDEIKSLFWEKVRDYINKHRKFFCASWSLQPEVLDQLEVIIKDIAPDDVIQHHRWLFDNRLPNIPNREDDFKHREEKTMNLRIGAVKEILKKREISGLAELGTVCKFPESVATTAIPLIKDVDDVFQLLKQSIAFSSEDLSFASKISWEAKKIFGDQWQDLILSEIKTKVWNPSVAAALMIWWPDNRDTWEIIENLGESVKKGYWQQKQIYFIEGKAEDQIYQVKQYMEVGRVTQVFDSLTISKNVLPSELVLGIFDATFNKLEKVKTEDEFRRLVFKPYKVQLFLDQLRKRKDIPREEIASREYRALPLLGFHDSGNLAIHEIMAEDPSFFVTIICDAYRRANRDKTQDKEPTPKEQARAEVAFKLLRGMYRIPGQDEAKIINKNKLILWIDAVRSKASEQDRALIADQSIGGILAHAPTDTEDNGWPHRVVRDVIERYANKNIDLGLTIERFNMRGVTSNSLYEGGDQERNLASQYKKWAEISSTKWPRMTQVLLSIARDWEAHARQEDARAEQEKIE